MRKVLAVLSLVVLSGCATISKIQPVSVACKACSLLQGSGICTGLTAPAVPKCEAGRELYVVNFDKVLKGAPAVIECR